MHIDFRHNAIVYLTDHSVNMSPVLGSKKIHLTHFIAVSPIFNVPVTTVEYLNS